MQGEVVRSKARSVATCSRAGRLAALGLRVGCSGNRCTEQNETTYTLQYGQQSGCTRICAKMQVTECCGSRCCAGMSDCAPAPSPQSHFEESPSHARDWPQGRELLELLLVVGCCQ